jgi:hypothetical protein
MPSLAGRCVRCVTYPRSWDDRERRPSVKRIPRDIFGFALFVGLVAGVANLGIDPRAAEPGASKEDAALQDRRIAPKDAEIDRNATIDSLLEKRRDGDWSTAKGASLTGYVIQVEKEPEGDVHLALSSTAGETNAKRWVIVEVPPFWQSKSASLTEAGLRKLYGMKVKVIGWLFYDTDPSEEPRGTLWELHPVTSISKLD